MTDCEVESSEHNLGPRNSAPTKVLYGLQCLEKQEGPKRFRGQQSLAKQVLYLREVTISHLLVHVYMIAHQEEVENLKVEDGRLDERIREMQERLRGLSEDENKQRWLFVTEDDVKNLPCFQNQTLMAIKAPHGTTLEVPDPDEAVDYPQRRYRIVLRSTMWRIDVYLVSFEFSQFEENFEVINTVEAQPNILETSNVNENASTQPPIEENIGNNVDVQGIEAPRICSDVSASHDFVSGIMKVVPDIDRIADYWLLSDTDVSITDM